MKIFSNIYFIVLLITQVEIDQIYTKSSDNQIEFINKQHQKLLDKGKKCNLKKINIRNLNHLRLTDEDGLTAIICLLEALKEKEFQTSGILWTALGSLYTKTGQDTQATTCFKYATKLSGKISTFINEWSFLGPFVIGKAELDGDPLESFGRIQQMAKNRYKKNVKFYSELVPGGEISWTHLKQASENDKVQVKPSVNWNELVNSLGSMGIMEWQGWFVGELAVNEKEMNVLVQCLGVHTVFIGNVPVTGDVYHRDKFWYGVKLSQGLHSVYVKLRTEVNGQFACRFQSTKSSFALLEPQFLSDLVSGHLFSGYFTIPVMNYQHSNFLHISNVALTDLKAKSGEIINKLSIGLKGSEVSLAPGQVAHVALKLETKSGETMLISKCSDPESPWDIKFSIKFTTSAGTMTESVGMRCRHDRQSFLFSFEDHDGSIQHAAAIQPLKDCPLGRCPVMLSMHGTSIAPQNQADSYKHMVDGHFVFGFDQAWTLAPTRHGAHNWEGPGSLTALSALESLQQLSNQASFFPNKADAHHVLFAGHSMGGHGAWHIATHYPDRALALVSLAGWIKKEEYGDDNLFFRHDVATSHVQPAVKSVLESCIVENDVDQHVTNLHGVSIVTRIGAKDRTVHPVFARRMYRLLKEEGFSVNHTEVKDKEHWWWDTMETNDGGAVHDAYLRDFANTQISSYLQSLEGSCVAGDCSEAVTNQYSAGSLKFTLTCYNPAAMEGVHGLRILQQMAPHKKSEIKVTVSDGVISLQTTNVQRFSLSHSPNRPVQWQGAQLMVDTSEIATATKPLDFQQRKAVEFCRSKGKWSVCTDEDVKGTRSLAVLGPARRVAEQPFKVVIGTQGSAGSQLYIQQAAVYIANLFFLTSDTIAPIVKDVDISADDISSTNVIVVGNISENLHTPTFLDRLPLESSKDVLQLESCRFSQPRTGVLTLAPSGDAHLALLLLGSSQEGLHDVVSLAAPTIPPMTRSPFSNLIPDFVITGPELGSKGPGGYLCTGFYGNRWEYRADLSSCICSL